MAGIVGAGSIPFIACVTLLAAMVLQVLSYAAPFWARDSTTDFGLWRKHMCESEGCYKEDHEWYIGAWLDAVRAMESLAIIFWSVPLVVLPVYIYVALGLYYKCLMGTMSALTLLGAICNLVGFLVYASQLAKNDSWSVGWCFILCVIADGFGFLSCIILVIATCKRPKFALDHYYTSGYYIHPDRNALYVIENVDPVKDGSIFNGGHMNPIIVRD